jgi:hypothetical protein
MKHTAYSNGRMLSMDGSLLAACDLKRLGWYVMKNLAEWEPGHGPESAQPTIRLNFQHRQAETEDAERFYSGVKVNQCVGCGESGNYLKYRCVCSHPGYPTGAATSCSCHSIVGHRQR